MPRRWAAVGWVPGASLAVVAVVAGCRHAAPVTEAAVDPCVDIQRDNDRVLATLDGADAVAPSVGAFRGELRAALRCARTPRGAWAIVVGPLNASAARIGGRWSLVHVGAAGARASLAPDTNLAVDGGDVENAARGENLEWSAEAHVVPAAPVLFDYDGDGEPEAVVLVRTDVTTESGNTLRVVRGRVWSAPLLGASAEARIALYEKARHFVVTDVRDVDGDGRPDLISHAPYAALASVKCGSDEPYPVYGPRLLAHAKSDGGFSWSDGQAALFARGDCPVSPGAPLLIGERSRPDIVDMPLSARKLACARLWGAAAEVAVAEIASRCRPIEACSTCDDAELLYRWARVPPPLRLSPSTAPMLR